MYTMTTYNEAIPLIELNALQEDTAITVNHQGLHLLIVVKDQEIYVIEDRCGHFGVSLKDGSVEKGIIRCPVHGAKFDLMTGDHCNDLFENCDPINIFLWRKNNGWLEVFL